jgi:hypothetical protein
MPVNLPTPDEKKRQDKSWANAAKCLLCDRRICICNYLKKHDGHYKKKYPAQVYEQQARVPHLPLEEVNLRLNGPQTILLYPTAPFFEEIAFSYGNNRNYKIIYL